MPGWGLEPFKVSITLPSPLPLYFSPTDMTYLLWILLWNVSTSGVEEMGILFCFVFCEKHGCDQFWHLTFQQLSDWHFYTFGNSPRSQDGCYKSCLAPKTTLINKKFCSFTLKATTRQIPTAIDSFASAFFDTGGISWKHSDPCRSCTLLASLITYVELFVIK